MNKKGLTLIELLGVIVLITALAMLLFPKVLSSIKIAKEDLYNSKLKITVEAARRYTQKHSEYLPKEIGVTTEILVANLVDEEFMTPIDNPNGSGTCNGYVLITMLSDGSYEYDPNINCSNNINSANEDRLIANYKFTAFQEPTTNVFPRTPTALAFVSAFNGVNYGFGTGTNLQQTIDNTMQWDTRSSITKVSRINSGVSQSDYASVEIPSPRYSTITVTFWYYGTYGTILRPYNNDNSANLYYLDDNGYWAGGATGIDIPVPVKTWKKITIKMVNRGSISGVGWSWTVLHNDIATATLANTEYWLFTQFQVEDNPYALDYTTGTTEGTVVDSSGSGNHLPLVVANTPQWTNSTYYFDGVTTTYISMPNDIISTADARANGTTISAWIKRVGTTNQRIVCLKIDATYADCSNGGIGLNTSFKPIMTAYSSANPASVVTATGATTINTNTWYHIVGVYDNVNGKLYVYVDGKLDGTASIGTFSALTATSSNRLGSNNHASNIYPFYGYLGNTRIYNRVLTQNEIYMIYVTEKDKFK